MEWSEEHDVLFLREMLARNVFGAKKGSPARGLAWEAIVQLKVKKVVRERWNLLRKKMSEEARKRGREGKWDFCGRVNGKGITELESYEELVEREDAIQAKAESASKQQLKDKSGMHNTCC